MTRIKGSVANFIVTAAILGAVLTPVLIASDAFAAKKGLLSTEQRAKFKSDKIAFRKDQRAAVAAIRPIAAPWTKAKREFELATRESNRSTVNLASLRTKLNDTIAAERKAHAAVPMNAILGTPFTPSSKLQRQQTAFNGAEAFHTNGPMKRFNDTKAKYDPLNTQITTHRAALTAASNNLATRKANKNAARANNYAAFKAAAAARRAARIAANAAPAPVVAATSSQVNPRFANQFGVIPQAPSVPYSQLPPQPAVVYSGLGVAPGYTTVPPLAGGQN